MALFSERYGYLKPSEVIVRESITNVIQNSIYNWITMLWDRNAYYIHGFNFRKIEEYVWLYFFNQRTDTFRHQDNIIRKYILSESPAWYKKLDLIEFVCNYINQIHPDANLCIDFLNTEFERHNFAYRYVDGRFIEITSNNEIEAIDKALTTPIDGVKTHLQTALKLLSASQVDPDYRNSIKESISAVECLCREMTGTSTLDDALKHLAQKGISINPQLKKGFENLYYYTNDKRTGVRHALMDDTNAPTSAEAMYMLITCSAFINYLNMKNSQHINYNE